MHAIDLHSAYLLKRNHRSMKICLKLLLVCAFWIPLSGCGQKQAAGTPTPPTLSATEIPCPGVPPRGLTTGMRAYVSIDGKETAVGLHKDPESTDAGKVIPHHIRVTLKDGPTCAGKSAWWQIELPDGDSGWMQIGPGLEINGEKVSVALLPDLNDAVQRDVPEDRKQEAETRYIVADIELGGADVLKYYQEQADAKPDDPGTVTIQLALDILRENAGKSVVANKMAFERKPLRGGTSIVDAGTEFVQPGLDILLEPCDRPNPTPACQKMMK